MNKLFAIALVLLLLTTGVSLIPKEKYVVEAAPGVTRGVEYWSMDMNITNASLASFIGEDSKDYSGAYVSCAGDVNNDGLDDILIGARYDDDGAIDAGQTYLILGKASGWAKNTNLSTADASFIGEFEGDYSGRSVSGAGDVDGDGYDDFLIGAYNNSQRGERAGKTYLIFGKATEEWSMDTYLSDEDVTFIGESARDNSGYSVSGAGDVDGDGYDDFLIGSYGSTYIERWVGKTYLILGKETGWTNNTNLSNADASFYGESQGDNSGRSVSGVGDVNNDGYDDILIGAFFYDVSISEGQTYLILGKATEEWSMNTPLSNVDASFIGVHAGERSGYSVSGAGDVNGDGFDDILIGAECNNDGGIYAGKTYLILGKGAGWSMDNSLFDADASFIGEYTGDHSGISVSEAGDVNGDGYDDILIGAYHNDEGGNYAGQAYMILGKESGWSKNNSLNNSDASFIGEYTNDCLGNVVSGAGDVNGDGIDDIIIGAYGNDYGGSGAGKTYLIPGDRNSEPKEVYSVDIYSDTAHSVPVSVVDIGDKVYVELLGLDGNETTQDTAFVNITFGLGTLDLRRVYCIETGINTGVYRGTFVIPTGTIYFDTLNFSSRKDPTKFDTLFIDKTFRPTEISSLKTYYDQECTIEVDKAGLGDTFYIEVIGTDANPATRNFALVNISSGNSMPIPLPILLQETGIKTGVYRGDYQVPESFIWLENIQVVSCRDPGYSVSVNVDKPFRPISIDSLKVYSNSGYSNEIDKIQSEETMHMEVIGQDANALTRDFAFINITSDKTIPLPILILLRETDVDTGIYRGEFFIPNSTKKIENITVTSVKDPSKSANIMVCTLVEIGPEIPMVEVDEDLEYSIQYSNIGYADIYTWTFECDKEWISFDPGTMVLSGTPDNGNVGLTVVSLNLSDDIGHFKVQEFQITVNNVEPIITDNNILIATQDQPYYNDYDSTDDGVGNTTYHIWTDAHWLTIDENTGELSGTPTNDDVGKVQVGINVHDGNGGLDHTEFNITVVNVNDGCFIETEDILTVYQDEPYRRTYSAVDIDSGDSFTWSLYTDAEWLSMDEITGVLEGTPTNDDVGIYTVNISVMDTGGLGDSTEFQLEVLNVNDRPEWIDAPEDTEITHGEFYYFETNSTDIDPGTTLSYSISTNPDSEMMIDIDTGIIEWHSTIHIFEGLSKTMEVTIGVFDGSLYNNHTFVIEVLPSRTPSVTLLSPSDGDKISSTMGVLTWEGSDPEGDELIYSLYLSKEEPLVSTLQEIAIVKTDFNSTSFTPGILEVGEVYYWTVIPNDECSDGRCSNDVFSFEVNAPPKISGIDPQKASSGSKFSFYVIVTDADDTSRDFSLDEAPDGMTIDDLGKIEWKPTDSQVGEHIVIVNVSDGVDYELVSFKLTVAEGEEEPSSLLPIILVIAVILIIAAIVIFFVMRKKKDEEEETPIDEEKEVELTKEETYEAMYGESAPKEEEGMTTEDLKGFIHEQIEELEGGEE